MYVCRVHVPCCTSTSALNSLVIIPFPYEGLFFVRKVPYAAVCYGTHSATFLRSHCMYVFTCIENHLSKLIVNESLLFDLYFTRPLFYFSVSHSSHPQRRDGYEDQPSCMTECLRSLVQLLRNAFVRTINLCRHRKCFRSSLSNLQLLGRISGLVVTTL